MARVQLMARVPTLLVVVVALSTCLCGVEAQLAYGYYDNSCPRAEEIISETMARMSQRKPQLPADLLRLHFHDCFVRGCDASVLLDGPGTEQKSPSNFRLEGLNRAVDALKQAVERACPNKVSCADILAFAARDGVAMRGGPRWAVRGGRRDGHFSFAAEATASLPGADMSVDQLTANFAKQGLTRADMVHLSGAHTLGDSGCVHIDSRIYKYPSASKTDPILTPEFLAELRSKCPKPNQRLRTIHLDRATDMVFDTKYYENLVERKGLLTSDQVLYEDRRTKQMVTDNLVKGTFFENFVRAMVKMSEIKVLTGKQGEIRKRCYVVNRS